MKNHLGSCPRCGDANAYTNLVCSGCGSRLPWAATVHNVRQSAAPMPVPREADAHPEYKIIAWACAGVFFLVAIVPLFWILSRSGTTQHSLEPPGLEAASAAERK